jgi:nucleotide-binding universal stress UspA family protein
MFQSPEIPVELFKPGSVLLCKFHSENHLPVLQQPLEVSLRHKFNMCLKLCWFSSNSSLQRSEGGILSRLSEVILLAFRDRLIVDRVLAEAKKGYDLLILDIESSCKDFVYPHLDNIIRLAPCPSIIIFNSDLCPPYASHQLLVYMDDSPASRHAFEVGLILTPDDSPSLIVLSTVHRSADGIRSRVREQTTAIETKMERIRQLHKAYDVDVISEVRVSDYPEQTILEVARSLNVKTILLGSSLQPGSAARYLDPMIDHLRKQSEHQVIVVNSYQQ